MAWYKDGQVTVQSGSRAVAGVGTAWLKQVMAGEGLDVLDGRLHEIAEVISNTELLLVDAYAGASAAGVAYQIIPSASMTKELTRRVNLLVATHEEMTAGVQQAYASTMENAAKVAAVTEQVEGDAQAAAASAQSASESQAAAHADSDAAMGYRNEARAARDSAGAEAADAAQHTADAQAASQQAVAARDAAGAYAQSIDPAALRDRANHTGTQSMETVDGLSDALEALGVVAAKAVPQTSVTGAAILPEGPPEDRPSPVPEVGLLVRGNSTTGKPEWYDRSKSAWKSFGAEGGGELFSYAWHNGPRGSIATLTPGRIPADGQQITLLQYPDAVAAILAGKQNVVTEAVWQADPTKRNCWSLGDAASWVRVPDLNAVQAGTGKPFYLRGGADALNGTSAGDAIRNITGTVSNISIPAGAAGAFGSGAATPDTYALNSAVLGSYPRGNFDVSRVVPTADENRVKTAYGVMTVRIFTEAANAGSVDAATLASQLAVVDAKVQALDAATGFTILYPNGGSAAAPANVAVSTRYVMPNPFPGSFVFCVPQLLYGGIWGDPGWDGNTGSGGQAAGARAGMANSDVVLQTAATALLVASFHGGNMHAVAGGAVVSTPLPCRVLCWKLKGTM